MKYALSIALLCSLVAIPFSAPQAKIPGATHCHNDVCHRVRTLSETAAAAGAVERVFASYYDHPDVDRFTPGLITSSGAEFDPASLSAVASPTLPDGTVILIRNPQNGRAAVVRVTDGGPYFGKRTLDLSRGLADALGTRKAGVVELELVVLRAPSAEETSYKLRRSYEPLPGPIGIHDTLASAQTATESALIQAAQTSPIKTASISVKPAPMVAPPVVVPAARQVAVPKPAKQADTVVAQNVAPVRKALPSREPSDAANFVASSLNRAESLR